jgi:hypothetical protein
VNRRNGRPPKLFFAALLLGACTATPPALDPGGEASGGPAEHVDGSGGQPVRGGAGGGQAGASPGGSSGTGGRTDGEPPATGGAGDDNGGTGGNRGSQVGGSGGSIGGRGGTGAGGTGGGSDAGPPTPPKDAALPPDTSYNTPVVCTSGDHWTNGDRGALAMYPGRPCIACHAMKRGPAFSAAGTIFATAHEPDDCNGVDGLFTGAAVVITDATGKVFTTGANVAGNFEFFSVNDKITPPYHAKVIAANGRERAMVTAQMSGDCNACHTVSGTMAAPGRIMLP